MKPVSIGRSLKRDGSLRGRQGDGFLLRFLSLVLFTACHPLWAQAPAPSFAVADISESQILPNREFSLSFLVKLPKEPEVPALPKVEGLVFGKIERRPGDAFNPGVFVFDCTAKAEREGDFVLPPIAFSDGEESVRTEPLPIAVRWPRHSDRMQLSVRLSKSRCYAGEPVELFCTWTSQIPFDAIKAVEFDFPILNDKHVRVLTPYEPGISTSKEAMSLPVGNTRIYATLAEETKEDKDIQSLTFRRILIPEAGLDSISIPAGTLVCAVPDASPPPQRRGYHYLAYFDNSFFDHDLHDQKYSWIYARSNPASLDVLALPAEGKPALFGGLVGSYSIACEASPTTVRAGDPIFLTITVAAKENPEAISLPSLSDEPGFAENFEISANGSLPKQTASSRIFHCVIRPRNAGVREIPPISLAFFNPQTTAYETATTPPIPLQVTPASSGSASSQDPHKSYLRQTGSPDVWHRLATRLWDAARRHRILLSAGAGLLIVLIGIAVGMILRWQQLKTGGRRLRAALYPWISSPACRRFLSACARLSREKDGGSFYRALYPLLRDYFANRLNLTSKGFDLHELQSRLKTAGINEMQLGTILEHYRLAMACTFMKELRFAMETAPIVEELAAAVKTLDTRAPCFRSLRKETGQPAAGGFSVAS